jgi:hypothetical protein
MGCPGCCKGCGGEYGGRVLEGRASWSDGSSECCCCCCCCCFTPEVLSWGRRNPSLNEGSVVVGPTLRGVVAVESADPLESVDWPPDDLRRFGFGLSPFSDCSRLLYGRFFFSSVTIVNPVTGSMLSLLSFCCLLLASTMPLLTCKRSVALAWTGITNTNEGLAYVGCEAMSRVVAEKITTYPLLHWALDPTYMASSSPCNILGIQTWRAFELDQSQDRHTEYEANPDNRRTGS